MGRLIDADRLKAHYAWWEDEGEEDRTKRLFDEIVDQQPTVAQVTNCRDCRYWGTRTQRCALLGTDKLPEGYCDEAVKRRRE